MALLDALQPLGIVEYYGLVRGFFDQRAPPVDTAVMSSLSPAVSAAYRTVFQPEACPTSAMLAGLDAASVKRAYRRRAMQFHPDRAELLGVSPDDLQALFATLNGAYDLLRRYVSARPAGSVLARGGAQSRAATPPPRPSAARTRSAGAKRASGAAAESGGRQAHDRWQGRVPWRQLPFGEYLYYTKRVGRAALNEALAWQRRQRPNMGSLAREWGVLNERTVNAALAARRDGERLGDAAVRLGLLRVEQRDALLQMQRRQQRPIGAYFVAVGSLRVESVHGLVSEQWQHNARVAQAVA